MFISDSDTLASFCEALDGAPYIAVDTEFVRERTYYAELSLVQVAYGDHAAAIDPLAPDIDLGPLEGLLLDPKMVKVLHSGTEDMELLLQRCGELPHPVFDTQVAASLCGSDAQIGYARLVNQRLGLTLDKGSQRTNWSRRPLTPRQLEYALADVTHLCTLYEQLVAELAERGRTDWVTQDMEMLSDRGRYEVDPREAWRRIRVSRPTRRSLAILRELAAWRETSAQKRDLPRPWVLKNEAAVQLAQEAPRTRDELLRLSTLQRMGGRWRDADRVLAIVEQALTIPESEWPEVPLRPRTGAQEKMVKALRGLLKERCEAGEVATTVVATRRDLERLVTSDEPDIPALKGWRREFFGEAALALTRR
jgi:ribonuclease D